VECFRKNGAKIRAGQSQKFSLQHVQVFSRENTWCFSPKRLTSERFEAFQNTHRAKARKTLAVLGFEKSEQLNSQENTCT